MSTQLRWVVPDRTTTDRPKLQYRTTAPEPDEWMWEDWQWVPTEVIPAAEFYGWPKEHPNADR